MNEIEYSIRPMQIEDYKNMHKVWTDEKVIYMLLTKKGMSLEEAKLRAYAEIMQRNAYPFVLDVKDEGVVGQVMLTQNNYEKTSHVGQLSIMIRSDFQGKGFGGKLFKKIIEVADSLNILVLTIECHTDNIQGLKLYEKFGFVREGILRKRVLRDDGLRDIIVMSRISSNI